VSQRKRTTHFGQGDDAIALTHLVAFQRTAARTSTGKLAPLRRPLLRGANYLVPRFGRNEVRDPRVALHVQTTHSALQYAIGVCDTLVLAQMF